MSAQQWRKVIERFDAEMSGISVLEFCRREGLSKSAFHRQRARLKMPASQPTMKPSKAPHPQPQPRFVDLGPLGAASATNARQDAGWEIRLDLGGGVTLHLSRG